MPEVPGAGSLLERILAGQITGYLRSLIAAPVAVIATFVLALAWLPFVPMLSAWQARLGDTLHADAEVQGHRYVCDVKGAKQVVHFAWRLGAGEASCRMRSEALLRFTDAHGTSHDVAAIDPYQDFVFAALAPGYGANAYEQRVPLVEPRVVLERGAVALLEGVQSDRTTHGSSGGTWTQREALERRGDDPLVFTALAWLGPRPDAKVPLRYRPEDPEHAWQEALFDAPGSYRVSTYAAFVMVPVGIYLLWLLAQLYLHAYARIWSVLVVALGVLSTPFWAPHLLELVQRYSGDEGFVAALREDFDLLEAHNDLRTEPANPGEYLTLTNASADSALQAATLAGLVPPRPGRAFPDLGTAYDALCAGAGERLAALPQAERMQRFHALAELFRNEVDGPAWCLLPVALRELDDAYQARRELPKPAFDLVTTVAYEHPPGGRFSTDYADLHKLRERAKQAIADEYARRPELEE